MNVDLRKAVRLIKNGEIVAIPTETVYGLAADAFNLNAVKKIFRQKGRPPDNPLIVHISDRDQLKKLAIEIPPDVRQLADHFWPGPLSLVLKKHKIVPDIVTGGLDTVAIRMPDHSLTLSLIERTGPLTAPSANKSGGPSPTNPAHILEDFGPSLPILDGGSSKLGLESTVLDLTAELLTILRPGFVTAEMIETVLGKKILELDKSDRAAGKKSPGTRFTHYKPRASVHWLKKKSVKTEDLENYYILHGDFKNPGKVKYLHSYQGNFETMARDLYDHFRTADHLSCPNIFIEPFDDLQKHPLIPALTDRIEKAINS